jgi:hypothetical protein
MADKEAHLLRPLTINTDENVATNVLERYWRLHFSKSGTLISLFVWRVG